MKLLNTRRFSVLLLSGVLSVGLVACAEEEPEEQVPEEQVFEEEELDLGTEEDPQDDFGTDYEFEDEEPLEEFPAEPLGEEEVPVEPDIGE